MEFDYSTFPGESSGSKTDPQPQQHQSTTIKHLKYICTETKYKKYNTIKYNKYKIPKI
jgi:hypothetical protein